MPTCIFKLSAPKTMHLSNGPILPRNASQIAPAAHLPGENFSNLKLEKFSRGRNPRPLLTGEEKETGGEGIKVFLPVKERKEWKGVEGEGPVV